MPPFRSRMGPSRATWAQKLDELHISGHWSSGMRRTAPGRADGCCHSEGNGARLAELDGLAKIRVPDDVIGRVGEPGKLTLVDPYQFGVVWGALAVRYREIIVLWCYR